jgi:membrane associated rhomboid family serine protease
MSREARGPKYGYPGLFILMVLGLIVLSFLYEQGFTHLLANIFFSLIFFLAVYSLSDRKVYLIITLILALISLTTSFIFLKYNHPVALFLDIGSDVVIFGYLVVLISVKVFQHEVVDSETIFGALCIYFLLAFFWAFVFFLVDLIYPSSFDLVGRHKGDVGSYLYFSMVTLSTLGYGDIVPMSPPARALASLEAVLGQLYLVVVVARFVGMEIATRGSKKAKSN